MRLSWPFKRVAPSTTPSPEDIRALTRDVAEAEVARVIADSPMLAAPILGAKDTKYPLYAFNRPYTYTTPQDPNRKPEALISIDDLRRIADLYDILRSCINHLKREVCAVPIKIVVRDSEKGDSLSTKRIKEAERWFSTPGGIGGEGVRRAHFESAVLEDLCVVGAAAVWYQPTKSGRVKEVVAIDAGTIRPRVDPFGWPGPDEKVWEQWIYGSLIDSFTRQEMQYDGLWPVSYSPYFKSPVEWIINVVYTALKADEWNRLWLTEGNTPSDMIALPSTWTPEQIKAYAEWFDSLLTGNSRERIKTKFMPDGSSKLMNPTRKDQDFEAFQLWLLRRVCSIMGVQPASIGYVGEQYKVSQEGSMAQTTEFGAGVLLEWRKAFYDDMLARLGYDDLELQNVVGQEEEAKERAERNVKLVAGGIKKINEAREEEGLDPDPDGDLLLIPTSLTPLKGLEERTEMQAEQAKEQHAQAMAQGSQAMDHAEKGQGREQEAHDASLQEGAKAGLGLGAKKTERIDGGEDDLSRCIYVKGVGKMNHAEYKAKYGAEALAKAKAAQPDDSTPKKATPSPDKKVDETATETEPKSPPTKEAPTPTPEAEPTAPVKGADKDRDRFEAAWKEAIAGKKPLGAGNKPGDVGVPHHLLTDENKEILRALHGHLHILDDGSTIGQYSFIGWKALPMPLIRAAVKQGWQFYAGNKGTSGLNQSGIQKGHNHDNVMGLCCYGPKKMYVAKGALAGTPSTVIHEFGHTVDGMLNLYHEPVINDHHKRLWHKLPPYQKQGGAPTGTARREFIAETFRIYFGKDKAEFVKRYDEKWYDDFTKLLNDKMLPKAAQILRAMNILIHKDGTLSVPMTHHDETGTSDRLERIDDDHPHWDQWAEHAELWGESAEDGLQRFVLLATGDDEGNVIRCIYDKKSKKKMGFQEYEAKYGEEALKSKLGELKKKGQLEPDKTGQQALSDDVGDGPGGDSGGEKPAAKKEEKPAAKPEPKSEDDTPEPAPKPKKKKPEPKEEAPAEEPTPAPSKTEPANAPAGGGETPKGTPTLSDEEYAAAKAKGYQEAQEAGAGALYPEDVEKKKALWSETIGAMDENDAPEDHETAQKKYAFWEGYGEYVATLDKPGEGGAEAPAEEAPAAAPEAPKAEEPLDFSTMKKVGEKPGGSLGGGIYEDANGEKWLVKFSPSEEHAKNEVLAGALFKAAGENVPDLKLVKDGDKTYVASKWLEGVKGIKTKLAAGNHKDAHGAFAANAWLANWDAAGLNYDNMVEHDGKLVHIDVGGALKYRAQGGEKGAAFGNEVAELLSLKDHGKNPQSAKTFSGMSDEDLKAGAEKIAKISDEQIKALVAAHGMEPELAEKLIQRKADLLKKAGVEAPKDEPTPSGGGEKTDGGKAEAPEKTEAAVEDGGKKKSWPEIIAEHATTSEQDADGIKKGVKEHLDLVGAGFTSAEEAKANSDKFDTLAAESLSKSQQAHKDGEEESAIEHAKDAKQHAASKLYWQTVHEHLTKEGEEKAKADAKQETDPEHQEHHDKGYKSAVNGKLKEGKGDQGLLDWADKFHKLHSEKAESHPTFAGKKFNKNKASFFAGYKKAVEDHLAAHGGGLGQSPDPNVAAPAPAPTQTPAAPASAPETAPTASSTPSAPAAPEPAPAPTATTTSATASEPADKDHKSVLTTNELKKAHDAGVEDAEKLPGTGKKAAKLLVAHQHALNNATTTAEKKKAAKEVAKWHGYLDLLASEHGKDKDALIKAAKDAFDPNAPLVGSTSASAVGPSSTHSPTVSTQSPSSHFEYTGETFQHGSKTIKVKKYKTLENVETYAGVATPKQSTFMDKETAKSSGKLPAPPKNVPKFTEAKKLSTGYSSFVHEHFADWKNNFLNKPENALAKQGFINYTGSSYVTTNKYLRMLTPSAHESAQVAIKGCDKAYETVPGLAEHVHCYRGIGWNLANADIPHPEKMKGGYIEDPGFGSASVSQNTSKNFANSHGAAEGHCPVLYEFVLPKGHKALPGLYGSIPSEGEFLLPRGMKYHVKDVKEMSFNSGPGYKMVLEIIHE